MKLTFFPDMTRLKHADAVLRQYFTLLLAGEPGVRLEVLELSYNIIHLTKY